MVIDIDIPKGWELLSQKQLKYLLSTISNISAFNSISSFVSKDDYKLKVKTEVAALAFFKWADLKITSRYADKFIVKKGKKEFVVEAELIADAVKALGWISEIPSYPVRLDVISGCQCKYDPDIAGMVFGEWLEIENYWIGYCATLNDSQLDKMAKCLYRTEQTKFKPKPFELLSIFYWWASIKEVISSRFYNFFSKPTAQAKEVDFESIARNAESQIRALTKGDVTKKNIILNTNVYDAISELDAMAKEYAELQAMSKNKS